MIKIVLIVLVMYSWSFFICFGFNGIHIGGDAKKSCTILKNLTKTKLQNSKYEEMIEEGMCSIDGYVLSFEDNKIQMIVIDSDMQNKLFNFSGLTLEERAQYLVNTFDWLSTLQYKETIANGWGSKDYFIQNSEEGYEFKLRETLPMNKYKIIINKYPLY